MGGLTEEIRLDQATLLRKHYDFQQGCFVSEHEESGGGIFAFSNVTPIPMWNHSAWIEGNDLSFRAFLEQTNGWQSGRNRRPVIYIVDPTGDQLAALRTADFEQFDREAWMVCRLDNVQHSRDSQVQEVIDDGRLQHFLDTFSASFQTKGSGYRSTLAANSRPGLKSSHFLLYDEEGRPGSVGTLVTDGRIGCVYNVGTPRSQRRKGFGKRIFEHIAAVAKENGCEALYLQVEDQSGPMRLYEKSGFRTSFVRTGFRRANWNSGNPFRAERTKLSSALGYRSRKEGATFQHLRETRALPSSIATFRPTAPSLEQICAAAWSYLIHRYTGEEIASFTLCERHTNTSHRHVAVKIEPSQTVREWTCSLPLDSAVSESDARESLLCINPEKGPNHLGGHEFPLEIHILPSTSTLEIFYRPDLYSKDSIRRMAAHLATAIDGLAAQPTSKVSELPLLAPEEMHQLLVEWNETRFVPVVETVAHLFESRVERTPDATALIFARTGQSQPAEQLTYRRLNRKANRLAHQLQEMGVGPNVFVGICLDRSPELIVSILAIFKAGGTCVPLDPSYPTERLRFMIQDTSAPVILTNKALLPILKGTAHSKIICLDDSPPEARPESEKNPAGHGDSDSPAYIIFTSGSTGKPKGVVITNRALANHCLDCCAVYGLSPRDRILQFSSFNFDAAYEQILPALISGATLVLRDDEVWNTREFADKLRDLQLTVTDIPTAYWHQLATEWAAHPEAIPNTCLRLVIVGGEALSPEKLDLWQKTKLSNVRLINAYGPTEAIITATSFEVPHSPDSDFQHENVPIGRPRGDRKVYVLDRYGNPAPIGIPGELHIGGSMLARGYHRRPELTATRFIQNPFSDEPEARLYRTGDLVRYLEDGNLEFLGRIDDQVKIRGFRIELGEVETCLAKHPSVRDAIVLARPNSSGDKQLVAYLLATDTLEIPELRAHIRNKLPEYMMPGRFVVLNQWPLLPSGKVDRLALPEPSEDQEDRAIKGPEDPLELQLQLLFERVLKRAPVGVDASFFELGGDSLQALELLVEIEKSTGKQLPLGTLYQSATVQTLAREVRTRATDQPWTSLVPLQVSGKRAPLFLMHTTPGDILGYGNLVYRLSTDQPCYGFQSLGLKSAECSHTSIEQMAEYYTTLLREFQPRGPYYLGGWCYGGIVAVEMARTLQAQGEEVALLALLETVAMPAQLTNLRYYRHRFRSFLKMSPQRWITYFRAKARYARESRVANRMRFRQAENCLDGELRDPRLIQLEQVYNTNLAALESYKSKYYNGKVTLFNAAERDPSLIPDPNYGWVGLAREIEIHEVPGNHDTMLTEPNVSSLAERLNECLLHAQKTNLSTKP
jgi:amino acid adenylation domain-containing protein